jgi:hypothetical protein
MGQIADRLSDIAKRCRDLSPLREPITRVLTGGNKRDRMQGLDWHGQKFKELKPYTIAHRKSASGRVNPNAPPLVPGGELSRVIADYRVQVIAGPGELRILGGWPTFPEIEGHIRGAGRLPVRDPLGFARRDVQWVRGMMAPYVMKRKWRPWG